MQPLWECWQAEPCLPRLQPRRDSRLRKGRRQRAQPPAGASAEPTSPFGVSLRARPYGVGIDRRSWLHGPKHHQTVTGQLQTLTVVQVGASERQV
jgi:hypothetical protein